MKNQIIALIDYKGKFGSKHFDQPYRSGMDKELLQKEFHKYEFNIKFVPFSRIFQQPLDTTSYFLYTSSEDVGYLYKSYIEDVVLTLEDSGCNIIPRYRFLRANNNKVFMELMRTQLGSAKFSTISSYVFGTMEEGLSIIDELEFPVVLKTAAGASGSGVYKANNSVEYIKLLKKVSNSYSLFQDIWETGRKVKHDGYIRESNHRNKFIVQNFVPGLMNDWKIYFFGNKYYVFYRPVLKKRGFRASGGGYNNYFYGDQARLPHGLLDYVANFVNQFDVPHASIDVAYDGNCFHIIEFQFTYFGTAGIPYSKGFYVKSNGNWQFTEQIFSIEQVYVESIINYILR